MSSTSPQSSSLKGIPLEVPPQATYSHSASTGGTPSPRTSCVKALFDSELLPTAVHRLKASRIRFSSPPETAESEREVKRNWMINWRRQLVSSSVPIAAAKTLQSDY